MLNARKRGIIQKLVIGVMVFAMFGFAFMRWIRLKETSARAEKITYDSDLQDQIPKDNPPIVTPTPKNNEIGLITEKVNQANGLFIKGQNEKSIQVLEDAVNRSLNLSKDKTNPYKKIFRDITDQIIIIQLDIKNGKKADVATKIQNLLKTLNAERAKVSQLL